MHQWQLTYWAVTPALVRLKGPRKDYRPLASALRNSDPEMPLEKQANMERENELEIKLNRAVCPSEGERKAEVTFQLD